ncbi:MAG: AAA family ATPase, partial [Planctomycetes bacterium]|nr:AAA family ATPase [Planctomycetota bacterium]
MPDAIVDACCFINLYATGDLRGFLTQLAWQWHIPSAALAESLFIRKVSDEDDETDFHERLGYISKAIDLSWEEWSLMEYRLHFEKLSPSILVNEPRQVSKPGDEAKPALSKLCLMSDRVALFILDPMISYFSGEENASTDANHFISTIERYLTSKGASVLIVHHSNKAPSNSTGPDHAHSRGSTAFRNRSRFAWELITITAPMASERGLDFKDEADRKRWVVLSLDKGNHQAPGFELTLRRITGGVLVRQNAPEKI